ncbi:MAG: hypothetical protein ACI3ZQ_01000 [Candidatus Cryptobacteroides sp.]
MRRFISYIITISLVLALSGCVKDLMPGEIESGKGKAKLTMTLDFQPLSTSLEQTKAAGDALKSIKSLYVLIYNADGSLQESMQITDYELSDIDRTDAEAENGHTAESQTQRAKFKIAKTVPFGKYYVYAVANIDNLLTEYSSNIQTVDGLKSIPLTWHSSDITENAQMMGYFTVDGVAPEGELITLNKTNVTLHAWIRRAASKVTIAYDGSQLKEGVFIYIKSVQIKDIPSQCYLGKDNKVGAAGYDLDYPSNGVDMIDGEIIRYHSDDPDDKDSFDQNCSGHRIASGKPYFGSGHGEDETALYFYENIQGAGDAMPDKRQDSDKNGELDHPGAPDEDGNFPDTYRLKDDVPYGTYIEVKAHYVSLNMEKIGDGPIIYRFMLGQDTIKDYNARRNSHYKLTLKFKNFANEADWHIEYVEPEPSVIMLEPYYISYLYNHSCEYPIKIKTGGRRILSIKAEIKDNSWAPNNARSNLIDPIHPIYYANNDVEYGDKYPWNGFLSLHKTTKTLLVTGTPVGDSEVKVTDNKEYYYRSPKRGYREFTDFDLAGATSKKFTTKDNALATDTYLVEKVPDEEYTYNVVIPFYTRAKQMISTTGYTGNNPYVAYERHAKVHFSIELEGLAPFERDITVKQVRRIVNPKGIYRSKGKNDSFHVQLMRQEGEESTEFRAVESEGEWKAYIIRNDNGSGITLSGTEGKSILNDNGTFTDLDGNIRTGKVIQGKTGGEIDFNIDFSDEAYSGNRYAVIRVEYHNNTCYHLIFVRQGNEPDDLIPGGTRWYAENMVTQSKMAASPLEEGSLFKFKNWAQPIDAMSNKNSKSPWTNVIDTDFKAPGALKIATGGNDLQWGNIDNLGGSGSFENPTVEGKTMSIATYDDYMALRNSDDIEVGYGVMYGDDATQCATNIIDAYEYDYEHNTTGRGMRGCFAYSKTTGKSLFFPIGASGYGHRRANDSGKLRYSSGRTTWYGPDPSPRPLFYDLYRRPGAVYWYNTKSGDHMAWDINYFTFDFNDITSGNLSNGGDACFVRCVER